MRKVLPSAFFNTTSLIGGAIAIVSIFMIVLLFLMATFSAQPNPYLGMLLYIFMPGVMIIGLVVAFVGAWRTYRRQRAGIEGAGVLPSVDLNDTRQRRIVMAAMIGAFLFLMVSAFGSYQAYEYTDSVQFCGQVCHKVMKPEFTAYQASPHARVACVECHIGAGATWFVRSKISGSYQVYATLLNKYPRPIPTPVANLRPARETCEECHWPRQFYSAKLQGKTYYMSDPKNTPSRLSLLVKIGGGGPAHMGNEGIHYHMYLNNEVRYIATDRQHNVIPYVESKGPNGALTVWRSTENPLTPQQEQARPKLLVDCIECHNRPTHIYHHPAQSVDQAMSSGRIDPGLPDIKHVLVEALQSSYKTQDDGVAGIRRYVEAFYGKYPQLLNTRKADIDAAITQAQGIYKLNYFPEMKVSWQAYPDHIGHMYSPGCFRCHDGKHVSQDGKVLTKDCNTCHTILSEQTGSDAQPRVSLTGLQFKHPVDIGDAWKETPCSDCHSQP